MIKVYTASTQEIDTVADAVAQVMAQLASQGEWLAQGVGIITCYPEFIDSGVVAALSEALPFEVIGVTTRAVARGKWTRCN